MVDFSTIVGNLRSSAGGRPMTKTASGRNHYDWAAGGSGLRIGTVVRIGSGPNAGLTGKLTQPFPGCRGDGGDWYGIFLDNDREANIRHTDIAEVKTASGWEPLGQNQRTAAESGDLRKARHELAEAKDRVREAEEKIESMRRRDCHRRAPPITVPCGPDRRWWPSSWTCRR